MSDSVANFKVDFDLQMANVTKQVDAIQSSIQKRSAEMSKAFYGVSTTFLNSMAGMSSKLQSSLNGVSAQISKSLTSGIKSGIGTGIAQGIAQGVGQSLYSTLATAMKKPGQMMGQWLGDAMDAKVINRKFDVVFGDLNKEAEKFSVDFANKIGGSKQSTRATMARFQDTFVPMGFSRDKSMGLSKTMTTLSGDLAASEGISQGDSAQRLMSGMVGNHEAVRLFGVMISEASLKQELLTMGIKGGATAATEQEKVLARLNLIIKGTRDAQGSAAKGAGDLRSGLGALSSIITEISAGMGNVFMPAAGEIVKFFKDIAVRISAAMGPAEQWGKSLGDGVKRVLDLMRPGLTMVDEWSKKFTDFIADFTSGFDGATLDLSSFDKFKESLGKVLDDANTRFQEFWTTFKDLALEAMGGLTGVFLGLFGGTTDEITQMVQGIGDSIAVIIEGVENAIAKFNELNIAKNAKYTAEKTGIKLATNDANWNASPEQQKMNDETERQMIADLDKKYGFDKASKHATSSAFRESIANVGSKKSIGQSIVEGAAKAGENYNAGVQGVRQSKLGQDAEQAKIAAAASANALRDAKAYERMTPSDKVAEDFKKTMLEQGNIDLNKRPKAKNEDGSISTVRSMSFQESEDSEHILIPTVMPNATVASDDDAIDEYFRTGKHLGKFKDDASATAFAEALHLAQETQYEDKESGPITMKGAMAFGGGIIESYKNFGMNLNNALGDVVSGKKPGEGGEGIMDKDGKLKTVGNSSDSGGFLGMLFNKIGGLNTQPAIEETIKGKKKEIAKLQKDKGVEFTTSESLNQQIQKSLDAGDDKALELAKRQLEQLEESLKEEKATKTATQSIADHIKKALGLG